jgi:hypothetical protein
LRIEIRDLAAKVKELKQIPSNAPDPDCSSESMANIMLAYRHLEGARMRLGKVLQAEDGGKSIYDK